MRKQLRRLWNSLRAPARRPRPRRLRHAVIESLEERRLLTIDMNIADASPGEGAGSAVLVVTLSAAPSSNVTVQFNTQEDTALEPEDFTSGNGTLTFTSGQTTQSITVAINNDALDEDSESFDVVLFNADGADIVDDTGVVTISDNDDPPTISIGDIMSLEDAPALEGDTPAVFTVSLSAISSKTITIAWATANGTATSSSDDYDADSGSLTFSPGESTQKITVMVIDDSLSEADESFKVNLSSPTNATLADGAALGFIIDSDATRQTNTNPQVAGGGSDFYSGNVRADFVTPGGLALRYNSLNSPNQLVVVETEQPEDSPIPDLIKMQLNFGGVLSTPTYFDTTGLSGGDPQRFVAHVQTPALETGFYSWTMTLTEYHGAEISIRTFTGVSSLVNRTESPFGSLWWVDGLDYINVGDGWQDVVFASGSVDHYVDAGPGQMDPPPWTTNELEKNLDDTFDLIYKDGGVSHFDEEGVLQHYTDRNGNRTSYSFTDGLLTGIEDPYGRATVLAYDNGLLESITDWVGRVTELAYTYGFLTSITAPDPEELAGAGGPVTEFAYAANGLLEEISDPLSHVTTFDYDFAGRLTRRTFDDESYQEIFPVLVQGLLEAAGSDPGTFGNPAELFTPDDAIGSVIDEIARETRYRTDYLGQPTWIEDAMNNVTLIERNVRGQPTEITLPDNDGAGPLGQQITTMDYDAAGNLIEMILPDASERHWTYGAFNVMATFTDELGRVTTNVIDEENGNILSVSRTDGVLGTATIEYTYTPAPEDPGDLPGGLLLTVTDAREVLTEHIYEDDPQEDAFGREIQTVYASGSDDEVTESREYSLAGMVTARIDGLGRRSEQEFDFLNRLIVSRGNDPDGIGGVSAPEETRSYDAASRLVSVIDAMSNETQYEYSTRNWLVRTVSPDPDGIGGASSPEEERILDDAGQLIATIDSMNRRTDLELDDLGRVITKLLPDPDGEGGVARSEYVYTYYVNGLLASETDPLSNTTDYAYSIRDWLISTKLEDPDGGGSLGRPETTQTWSLAGERLALTDPVGNTTESVYNDFGWVVEETNELEDTRYFSHDLVGNVVEIVDRNERVREFDFDDLSRLIEERWIEGESAIYTAGFTYNDASELIGAWDTFSTYDYTLDGLGRVTLAEIDNGGPLVRLAQTYNAVSSRTSLSAEINVGSGWVDDFVTSYTLDNLQRITRIEQVGVVDGNPVSEKRIDLAYNAASQFTTVTRYKDTSGGGGNEVATSTHSYDGMGRLTGLEHTHDSTNIADYAWTFDVASRVTTLDFDSQVGDDGLSEYGYDNTNQVVSADHDYQSDESFSFDENGNRTMSGYTTGDNNRLTSDGIWNYGHDDEGNRTWQERISSASADDKRIELLWDYRNRLTRIVYKNNAGTVTKSIAYAYDVFDRRIEKEIDWNGATGGGVEVVQYVYDGEHIALAFNGDEELTHRYVHNPQTFDEVFADEQFVDGLEIGDTEADPGENIWAILDNLGSTRDLVDDDGDVLNHIVYDAFGQITSETASSINFAFGYTGRETDEESHLQFNRARYYDATVGGWISEDPISFAASDANLARYVQNDPVNCTDPLGLVDLDKNTSPGGLREKEIVIFLGHFVPSDLTPANRAQAEGIQDQDEIRHALDKMRQKTDPLPEDAFISVVGCFPVSAEAYVDKLFPDTWLEGPNYITEDRITNGDENVRIAIDVYDTAVRQGDGYKITVYADADFKLVLARARNRLGQAERTTVIKILDAANKPRGNK